MSSLKPCTAATELVKTTRFTEGAVATELSTFSVPSKAGRINFSCGSPLWRVEKSERHRARAKTSFLTGSMKKGEAVCRTYSQSLTASSKLPGLRSSASTSSSLSAAFASSAMSLRKATYITIRDFPRKPARLQFEFTFSGLVKSRTVPRTLHKV